MSQNTFSVYKRELLQPYVSGLLANLSSKPRQMPDQYLYIYLARLLFLVEL